jgi:DNA-binding NarL/FixJ family response regulator
MDGLEATRHIKKALPDIAVVIMTMTEDPLYGVAALAVGANHTMVKNRIDIDLVPVLTNYLTAEGGQGKREHHNYGSSREDNLLEF